MISETKDDMSVVNAAASLWGVVSARGWVDFIRGESESEEKEELENGIVHESYSYLQDIVAQCKVGESIPGTFSAFLDTLASVQETFTAVIKSRHARVILYHWRIS